MPLSHFLGVLQTMKQQFCPERVPQMSVNELAWSADISEQLLVQKGQTASGHAVQVECFTVGPRPAECVLPLRVVHSCRVSRNFFATRSRYCSYHLHDITVGIR